MKLIEQFTTQQCMIRISNLNKSVIDIIKMSDSNFTGIAQLIENKRSEGFTIEIIQ